MSLEERLEIVHQMQKLTEKQITNREKSLELSKQLEENILDDKLRLEIKKLELENITLYKRNKELISKL
ncbi:hypothetical protein [Bacillus sp. FSL K6-3431]|uniref:hypothetical protein n=1 Tax=Bacillus sp. FSL K6-3431 TaxID=2921500 RepID=UPI0030F765EB